MTDTRAHRRLAALLAADVVGYSRLIEMDDSGTLAALKQRRRDILMPMVSHNRGRVVNFTGDGVLVEFGSAVDAVQCAVKLQEGFAAANTGLPENKKIILRMGVNLGDIIVEGQLVYGDGVNVAARLEGLSEPGSVWISANVHDLVHGKLNLAFDDLGEHKLKNIAKRVRIYRARASEKNLESAMAPLTLPDKPSIAVLPFINMSNDVAQDYFADGMTEDIITALSRIREFFVISRNSSFTFKGRNVRPEVAARDLGVKFLLEGSVRVAGERVRVTAQLIDGESGGHLWAERFDSGCEDIFAVQDEITRKIALALQVKLSYGDLARLWEGQTKDLRAWEKMARGRDLFLNFDIASARQAQLVLREALDIDPRYTGAMILLGLCHWWQARYDATADKDAALRLCEEQAGRALAINAEMGSAYMLRGGIAFLRDRHEEAMAFCERAVDLAPGDSWAMAFLGLVCVYGGKPKRALEALKEALRLSPYPPAWYLESNATAHMWDGNLAAARAAAEENHRLAPGDVDGLMTLATVCGFAGQDDDARRVVADIRRNFPAFGIANVIRTERYREPEKLERVVSILRRVGLQEL